MNETIRCRFPMIVSSPVARLVPRLNIWRVFVLVLGTGLGLMSCPALAMSATDSTAFTCVGDCDGSDMAGQFNSAIGVAADADGNVFVTDENHRVQKFACL